MSSNKEAEIARLREVLELCDRAFSALLLGANHGSVSASEWRKPLEQTQSKVRAAIAESEAADA